MICIRRRSGRSVFVERVVMSWPSNAIRPPAGSSRRSTVCAVVVLPQPDSPTSATSSPRSTLKLTPSTARTSFCGWRDIVAMRPRGTG